MESAVIVVLALTMLVSAGCLVWMVVNFINYHLDRGLSTECIWQIAWRGRQAGSDGT